MNRSCERQIQLGVNIDHVATLRQIRGTSYPDLVRAAQLAQQGGADNITVHLREDRRHIQEKDVRILLDAIRLPLNLEMSLADEIVWQTRLLQPPMVCIVPENRAERTTENGLAVRAEIERLRPVLESFSELGIRVSLFVDPVLEDIEAAAALRVHAIELHTGSFANAQDGNDATGHWEVLARGARRAHELGLEVHAGHGLGYGNIQMAARLPHVCTFNVGHAIVCESVLTGMQDAVHRMKTLIETAERNP
ncbi:Pyridoxal phosphate (active vitamin B6) biosynthesis PdxJ [mine drainage metagenome]|uniref:Pyridoxal phosphate (Active vitamin B6) biosynthesis PdxJ n=1 Tax=mine drainage metagenome TaxID=410659 RepID=T1C471_9ZZZZ